MYVRKEALLSSQIEGTQASLEDIFEFESGEKPEIFNDVTEVVNYVKALNYGIERLDGFPMSLRLIKEIHAVLMEGVRGGEKIPGEFKKSQNWIGPAGCALNEATYVPPPPNESDKAMGDLEVYLHEARQLPVLIECALVHYQFETIHPFLDGNGRLGRLLITYYLYWRGVLHRPLLYLSYYFKTTGRNTMIVLIWCGRTGTTNNGFPSSSKGLLIRPSPQWIRRKRFLSCRVPTEACCGRKEYPLHLLSAFLKNCILPLMFQ